MWRCETGVGTQRHAQAQTCSQTLTHTRRYINTHAHMCAHTITLGVCTVTHTWIRAKSFLLFLEDMY